MDFVQNSCQNLTTKGGVKTCVKSSRDITVSSYCTYFVASIRRDSLVILMIVNSYMRWFSTLADTVGEVNEVQFFLL